MEEAMLPRQDEFVPGTSCATGEFAVWCCLKLGRRDPKRYPDRSLKQEVGSDYSVSDGELNTTRLATVTRLYQRMRTTKPSPL